MVGCCNCLVGFCLRLVMMCSRLVLLECTDSTFEDLETSRLDGK